MRRIASVITILAVLLDKALHYCKPRLTLIPTHKNGASYVPSYVELKRCQGGLKDSIIHNCQPTRIQKLELDVRDTHGNPASIQLDNHLECEEACVCGPCGDKRSIPQCEPGFMWSENTCRCVHPCKSFLTNDISSEQKESLEEKSKGDFGFNKTQLALIMCAEFLTICIILFVSKKSIEFFKKRKQSKLTSFSNDVSYATLENTSIDLKRYKLSKL